VTKLQSLQQKCKQTQTTENNPSAAIAVPDKNKDCPLALSVTLQHAARIDQNPRIKHYSTVLAETSYMYVAHA